MLNQVIDEMVHMSKSRVFGLPLFIAEVNLLDDSSQLKIGKRQIHMDVFNIPPAL